MHSRANSSIYKFTVQLDSYDGLQALISHRLMSLASPKRQELLRQLLVKGFCSDCAEKRLLQRASDSVPTYTPAPRITEPSIPDHTRDLVDVSDIENRISVSATAPPTSLSALRAVMD